MTSVADELLLRLKQIEDMVSVPPRIGHNASAEALALSIARQAPTDAVASLATQLSVEVAALKPGDLPLPASNVQLNKLLWRLRQALEQARGG